MNNKKIKTDDVLFKFENISIAIKVSINQKWFIEIEGYEFAFSSTLEAQKFIHKLAIQPIESLVKL